MNRAVFLDRDGTINMDRGYVHRREDFILLPGAVEGLRLLQAAGFLLIIVTNQSGIGRGMFTEEEYLEFQKWVSDTLAREGVKITAQYYCPHSPEDGCICRKPATGLFAQAARDWELDPDASIAIGDRMRDLSICEERGAEGYLIAGAEEIPKHLPKRIHVVRSLLDAAREILGNGVYIFGAHSRAQTLCVYLEALHPELQVLGFLVDNEEANATEALGHPVLDLRDNGIMPNTSAAVYLGTRGVHHAEVTERLRARGFTDIRPVTPELDTELRMEYMKAVYASRGRGFTLLDDCPAGPSPEASAEVYIAHSVFDAPLQKEVPLRSFEAYVQAGAALADRRMGECSFFDDAGDSISGKNRKFCELTVLYWAWKNGTSPWIGLEHYRRRFLLPEDWQAMLGEADVILPVPLYVHPSLAENFRARHEVRVWEDMLSILKERNTQEYEAAEVFFDSEGCYSPCNMFIMRREVLDDLCRWLFPILLELEQRVGEIGDSYQNRYPGFVSERLISFFFDYHREEYRVIFANKSFLQ
jgi:D,D-heptose 1,7-bisphosphate phosphatase